MVSLGKYGSFPSNLIIHRPYHLTYEIQDKRADEDFCRLRIVPASEAYADVFADEQRSMSPARASEMEDETDQVISAEDEVEYSLVDTDNNAVVAKSSTEIIDSRARQRLTNEEIEELKKEGGSAGKELITKLILSHAAIDQKTAFSLAKYKLLKTKKYIRRFTVSPLDVAMYNNWQMQDKEAGIKIMGMRDEMLALLACWGNVHYAGEASFCREPATADDRTLVTETPDLRGGRYLVVDDTGGFLVAALAERMGILYPSEGDGDGGGDDDGDKDSSSRGVETDQATTTATGNRRPPMETAEHHKAASQHRFDFRVPFSLTNTITMIHSNSQPNLYQLKVYGFDPTDTKNTSHPLHRHLLTLSWLQALQPEDDTLYSIEPPQAAPEIVAAMKASRRGNYHRKRKRWARTRHVVDSTRAGGFSGLVVASFMDNASILRHTVPLLAPGAPVAIYSPTLEPLATLADYYSVSRRAAWVKPTPPPEIEGKTTQELERWEGSEDFPLNPTLLIGVSIQTSRVRKWQVLPGRTHPLMSARGGWEGYVLTGNRALPAVGRISASGTRHKKRKTETEASGATGLRNGGGD